MHQVNTPAVRAFRGSLEGGEKVETSKIQTTPLILLLEYTESHKLITVEKGFSFKCKPTSYCPSIARLEETLKMSLPSSRFLTPCPRADQ